MLQYEIAGLKFNIAHEHSKGFKRFKPFESSFTEKPDVEIKLQPSGIFATPEYSVHQNDGISWHVKVMDDKTLAHVFLKETGRTEYTIEARNKWSDITILYREGRKSVINDFCYFLGNFIISNKIIYHDGFVIHASSVSCSGKGIAFAAPSGTGKSTHAAMWKRYYKASILNDDCPVIRIENSNAVIHGTPWSGAKSKAMQSSCPLSMIVILEQSNRNSIRELTIEEAIPLLLPRIFLPYQNPALMDIVLPNIEKAVEIVPKYHLKCRANREATELVYQCLK